MSMKRQQLLVFAVAVAVFLISLGNGFVFDDELVVEFNTQIRSLEKIPEIFTSTEWTGAGRENHLYRPFTVTSLALNYALFGEKPWSYHLVNVLLHGLISVLVLRLGRLWGLSNHACVWGALLFAVHPVHVEVVASIVGRKDLLVTALLLGMVLLHARARERGGLAIVAPVLTFAAAALSKETGVTGIALVALHDFGLPRPAGARARRLHPGLYAGYLAVLVGYLSARWFVVGGFGVPDIPFFDNPLAHATGPERVMTALTVIVRGLFLLILPWKLSPDYSYEAIPVVSGPSSPLFLLAILVLAATLVAALKLRTKYPLLLAVGWYALTLLPVSNLLFATGTIFGERLLYLPSVAFALLAGALLFPTLRPRPGKLRSGIAIALLLAASAQAVSYAWAWRDDLPLFSRAVDAVPKSFKVHHQLGNAYFKAGRTEDAIASLERSLAIAPDNYIGMAALAQVYVAREQIDEAESLLEQALEVNPDYVEALYELGRLNRDKGDLDRAVGLWERAIQQRPNHAPSLSDLGTYQFLTGNPALATTLLERAVANDATLASAWYNLGLLYDTAGQAQQARLAYEQFVEHAGEDYAGEVARVRQMLTGRP